MGAEAVLIFNEDLKKDFKFHRKQAMQLSSKSRFLAAQFYAYLKNDLWKSLANHVVSEAQFLAGELRKSHPDLVLAHPVESNALFLQIPAPLIKPLRERCFFYIWEQKRSLCRWMISFDWTRENSLALLSSISEVKRNVL